MSIRKPCPRCKTPLEIPQPAPEQIRCDNCGAVIKNRASSSEKPSAVASTSTDSNAPAPYRPSGVLLAALGVGVLLFCLAPIVVIGLVWTYRGAEKKDEQKPTEIAKEEKKQPKPPPPPDPRIKIVQPAVDKGVAFIRTQVPTIATMRCGYVGLNGLALLECGVPDDDPDVLTLAAAIRKEAPTMKMTYDLAPSLFFLNRWNESRPLDEADRAMARSFALRILTGQLTTGIWTYECSVLSPEQEAKLLIDLQAGSYKPTKESHIASMSNTQFAMLAVWGSRKYGVPVRSPLLALARYFRTNQNPDGSWHYGLGAFKASATNAGLIGLAIESALLDEKEFPGALRPSNENSNKEYLDKAFEFAGKTIGRKKSDPGGGSIVSFGGAYFDADAIGDLYYLWTLERVGVIYSKELIADKNWYDWGYPIILEAQQPNGSWDEPHKLRFGPLVDTPFALLFLKRANIARDLTEIIRTRDGREVK